ncbi:hypothetical protein LTR27_001696 [Elasticomyces elasticus]|nr:hypothetical protein LTR27_001696 [Elasticomyces elasticus]
MDGLSDQMRELMPGSTGNWDSASPISANVARMVAGSRSLDGDLARVLDETKRLEGRVAIGIIRRDFHEMIKVLTTPDPQVSSSALLSLQQLVASVFTHGRKRAGGVYCSLNLAAEQAATEATLPDEDVDVEWRSCKAAATLVNLLACPKDRIYASLKYLSQRLGGMPTLKEIRSVPSSSLPEAYRKAKALARGDTKKTTVLAASFVDVHIFELAMTGKAKPYTSFAHSFVLGVGPEGVIIWQAWGEHGYAFDKYIERGGARLRTWQEAGDFIDRFDKLVQHKGKWDAKRNKLYKQCFEVDVNDICGPGGPSRPIVPEYEAWVRLMVFEDVLAEDLHKYTFKCQDWCRARQCQVQETVET